MALELKFTSPDGTLRWKLPRGLENQLCEGRPTKRWLRGAVDVNQDLLVHTAKALMTLFVLFVSNKDARLVQFNLEALSEVKKAIETATAKMRAQRS